VALPGGSGAGVSAAATDFDNDRDVDVAVAIPETGADVLLNRRDSSYEDLAAGLGAPALSAANGLIVVDADKDGMMDLLVSSGSGPRLLANRLGHKDEEVAAFSTAAGSTPTEAVAVTDADNDGFLDAALLTGSGVGLARNLGGGRWADVSEAGKLNAAGVGAGAAGLDAADLDGDGDQDLVAGATVLRNQGGGANKQVVIALKGLGDNRFGAGTKVEIRAGTLWQRFEAGTNGLPLAMGLGTHEKVDAVRMLWMGGVLQDEIEVETGKPFEIAQLDRKGTSCPILYAWAGEAIRCVTDFLGGSAYGYLEEAGRWSIPDTDEYVKIRADQLVARDGVWDLRLVNQLEEVIVFDRAQLLVVDHPASVEVYPNERLMPAPPYPPYRLYTAADAAPPAWARDEAGRDMTDVVTADDRRTVDTFELLPPKGYARPHALVLGLGERAAQAGRAGQLLLLLDGWIDYADSSSNTAAGQAGLVLVPPSLEARRPGGAWRTVIASTGFPAGLPKTMTLDLTGLLKPGETEVRLSTSMRIYWDRVRVATGGSGAETRVTRLDPMRADLAFLGYPRPVSPDGRKPFAYDYSRIASSAPWKSHAGAYTRFGDVRPLLASVDDRYVVTRNGDQLALAFDANAAPPLPEGWTRDFLLFADGFGKDMDPNSATPAMVGPLPYHGMPGYPYPDAAGFTADPARAAWLDEWNTRLVPADPLGFPGASPSIAGARLK
jgi:hypothetical protein